MILSVTSTPRVLRGANVHVVMLFEDPLGLLEQNACCFPFISRRMEELQL
jgi:hypothetical protein